MTTMCKLLGFDPVKGEYSVEVESEFRVPPEYSREVAMHWSIKDDGSLRGYSKEFITKKPASLVEVKEKLDLLYGLDIFKNYYKESGRTSTHVHVNAHHWTHEQLIQVLMVYYTCEPTLMKLAGELREGNLFCLPMYSCPDTMTIVDMVVNQSWKRLQSAQVFNDFKYNALNVASIGRLGTIEFRQLKGTGNVEEVKDWLGKIDSLVKKALSYKSVKELWSAIDADSYGFVTRALGVRPHDGYDENITSVFTIFNSYQNTLKQGIGMNITFDFGKPLLELELGEAYAA